MQYLFNTTISKSNWGKIFQSIDAFELLIKAICKRHNINCASIQNLTPGTNAVFRIDDKIIKIFAPVESGFYNNDFEVETEAQIHANNSQVPSPKFLHQGIVRDKYLFRYIIMEYINGEEAEKKLSSMTIAQKESFAKQLKQITYKLNVPMQSASIPAVTLTSCAENSRWNCFPPSFCNDRRTVLAGVTFDNCIYTHGDLTAENTILSDDGTIYIIDFADSRIAPAYYEWTPIVFGLFGCDKTMMETYFGHYLCDSFYEQLTLSVLMHEFGAGVIKDLCDLRNVTVDSITDVSCLKEFLKGCLLSGNTKVK